MSCLRIVCVQIFVYLQPLDVLNIMYTSRGFRTLLLSSSSTFIWKAVRLNVDNFPGLPDDMSEFRYAKLAFDQHCHKCGKKTQNDPFWEVRARFCDACVKVELVQATPYVDSAIYFCGYEDVLGIVEHRATRRGNNYPPRTSYFCKTHLNRLAVHVGSLSYPKAGVQVWLISEAGRLKSVREHARKCIAWQNEINRRQQEVDQQIRKKRQAEIHQRLLDLGMGKLPDEVPADTFNNHRLVKPAVPLTVGITLKYPFFDGCTNRKYSASPDWFSRRTKQSTPELISPNFQDFVAIAEVQAVIKTHSADALSEKDFGDMTILMDNWRKHATFRIGNLLETPQKRNMSRRKDSVQQDPRLKTLKLVTTGFGCSSCLKRSQDIERLDYTPAEYIHYPWVMAHPCVQNKQVRDISSR
ncbi:hypothetical protein BD410DRAFT_357529 [Rickenella mellea]|uniref:F-box domain-containing protein n=1 Tax=Rickenella mellea TaxID=50990 RepID=A0A4Y7Q0N8_9AGAM|nr:hypothetical protein BD410DRAFT_357529 [Rickenella mellea]